MPPPTEGRPRRGPTADRERRWHWGGGAVVSASVPHAPSETSLEAFLTELLPGTDWVVGVQGTVLEPFTVLAHAPELGAGAARRLAQYRIGGPHAEGSAISFPAAAKRAVLVASIPHDSRHHAVVVFARRSGSFTAKEERAVEAALPALHDHLARQLKSVFAGSRRRTTPALCILLPDLRIEYATSDVAVSIGEGARTGARLPEWLEQRIRYAVADWSADAERCVPKIIQEDGGRVIRVFALEGAGGIRIGVQWEPTHRETAVMQAVERYGMTRREIEILNLLAHGASSAEIANRLNIVESTVNEHIARMMQKTEAANRVELVARVLETPEL